MNEEDLKHSPLLGVRLLALHSINGANPFGPDEGDGTNDRKYDATKH